ASSSHVVGADITGAVAVWRVAVLRYHQCLARSAVKHFGLILWVNRTDGDAFYAVCQEVIDDALLFRGSTVSGNSEINLDTRYLFCGLFRSFACDGPELGRIVGHESELVLRAGAGLLICTRR